MRATFHAAALGATKVCFVYELSLFTGAGGGVLGTQHLLGWRALGYVEWDAYCQAILKARIQDGVLHDAPIFGDIREFASSGCAERYRGMVDVVTAGFPCQPFSVAGKKRGADDERNMWPATIECIRVVRPRFALLENVPGLIASGYFGTVIGDLAESGYDCRWRVLSAAEVGAPHKRDRLWVVAHARHDEPLGRDETAQRICGDAARDLATPCGASVGYTTSKRSFKSSEEYIRTLFAARSNELADAHILRSQARDECSGCACELLPWACSRAHEDDRLARSGICRVSHGVAHRVDRLKALGNGQVSLVAATAWRLLTDGLIA